MLEIYDLDNMNKQATNVLLHSYCILDYPDNICTRSILKSQKLSNYNKNVQTEEEEKCLQKSV